MTIGELLQGRIDETSARGQGLLAKAERYGYELVQQDLGPEVLSWDPEAVRELIGEARRAASFLGDGSMTGRRLAAALAPFAAPKPKRWRCKGCGRTLPAHEVSEYGLHTIRENHGFGSLAEEHACGPVEEVSDGQP